MQLSTERSLSSHGTLSSLSDVAVSGDSLSPASVPVCQAERNQYFVHTGLERLTNVESIRTQLMCGASPPLDHGTASGIQSPPASAEESSRLRTSSLTSSKDSVRNGAETARRKDVETAPRGSFQDAETNEDAARGFDESETTSRNAFPQGCTPIFPLIFSSVRGKVLQHILMPERLNFCHRCHPRQ